MSKHQSLVRVEGLSKHFTDGGGFLGQPSTVYALNDVSFEIREGEMLGVVGESGCGKSTLAKTMLRLHEPTEGRVFFDGREFTAATGAGSRDIRQNMQFIFQNPSSSLNPKRTVQRIVDEPLREYTSYSRIEREERVSELLEDVGLKAEYRTRYPHQFSGGQQQRINIARALALNPRFIIADEPFSAVDVSIKAQLMELFTDLQEKYDLTVMIVTHDMSVIRYLTDRLIVMYLGEIMEKGPTDRVFEDPKHPYTKALLSAISIPGKDRSDRTLLEGELPDPQNPPTGCPFHTRCPEFIGEVCKSQLETHKMSEEHEVRCHLYHDDVPDNETNNTSREP